jgi:hypothetical protein
LVVGALFFYDKVKKHETCPPFGGQGFFQNNFSMKFASVCSGIEAASMAWEPLGWQPVWFSEVAPFPSADGLPR